jgi:nucleotide-binding universal stress UspA family protein
MAFNNILVPVDFSTCSLDAFRSTLAIAKRTNSNVHILHASDLPKNWENWPANEKDENPFLLNKEKDLVTLLDELANKCQKIGVNVSTKWTTQTVAKSVDAYVKANDIDLIVMGSHGVSGKQEYFIGSNAQKVLRQIRIPLLVLKSELKQPIEFKKGLFASALFQNDKEVMHKFIHFGELFGLEEIHIVAIDTIGYFHQPPLVMTEAIKDFANSVEGLRVKTHFGKAPSVEAGIRHYSVQEGIDLIAISNKEKHPLKRMLVGSNVELLINHSQVPVLTMDWQD